MHVYSDAIYRCYYTGAASAYKHPIICTDKYFLPRSYRPNIASNSQIIHRGCAYTRAASPVAFTNRPHEKFSTRGAREKHHIYIVHIHIYILWAGPTSMRNVMSKVHKSVLVRAHIAHVPRLRIISQPER